MEHFKNKHILLISPESWGKSHVSKHHYALELAKNGAKVFFLQKPSKKFNCTEISHNLYSVQYRPLLKGVKYLPPTISALYTKIEIKKIERKLNVSFDIIWNFDTSRFFNLSKLYKKTRICHIVDMAENHQRKILAKTSDFCFCTSDFLADALNPYNNRVFKIHHGYQQNSKIQPFNIKSRSKSNAGFVGNLSRKCMDWTTILSVIEQNEKVDFHFVGSYQMSNLSSQSIEYQYIEKLNSLPNVILHGEVDSEYIPSFLEQMDILFCIYHVENQEDIAQHSNLHKMMEYLGSGKTIVSTWVDEFKTNQDLVFMTKNKSEIPDLFSRSLANIEEFNGHELSQKRKEFAESHSYKNQLIKIENILTNGN